MSTSLDHTDFGVAAPSLAGLSVKHGEKGQSKESGGSLVSNGLEGVVLWVPQPRTFMIGYIGTRLWFVAQVQPGHNSETARQCMASLNQIIFSKP